MVSEMETDFDGKWGVLFWFALFANAARDENIAAWMRLVRRVGSVRHQADIARITLVFAELVGTYRQWADALKEFDMQESQVVLEWTKDAREQERVLTLRGNLLELAETRFQSELTDEDRQMIAAQDSSALLQTWFTAALKSTDYPTFRAVLRR